MKPVTYRCLCIAAAALLLVVMMVQASFCLEVPLLRGRVNDEAGILSKGVVRQLDLLLKDFEEKESTQIVVLIISSLEGEELETFSLRVAEKWRIGHQGLDNGAILLIAQADRKLRIEVGYGLEGRLTDLQAGRIIRRIIVPEFQAGRFDQGVVSGVQAMIDTVRGEFKAEDAKDASELASKDPKDAISFLFLFVFIVFSFGRASRLLGTAVGGVLMPFFAHVVFSPGIQILSALAVIGLIAGFIISLFAGMFHLGGSSHSGSGRGDSGFSGGFSTGGSDSASDGGFSGGGGGFGGGGASGSW
jgi:uncharacterized protein